MVRKSQNRNAFTNNDFIFYLRAHKYVTCLQESKILGVGKIPQEIVNFIAGTYEQFEKYLSTKFWIDHHDEVFDREAIRLADALKVNSTVVEIILYANQISDETAYLLKATNAIRL